MEIKKKKQTRPKMKIMKMIVCNVLLQTLNKYEQLFDT